MARCSQPAAPFPSLGQELDPVRGYPLPCKGCRQTVDDEFPLQVLDRIERQARFSIG